MLKQLVLSVAVAFSLFALVISFLAEPASAKIVVTVEEVGNDVVISGGGFYDVSGVSQSSIFTTSPPTHIGPNFASVVFVSTFDPLDSYSAATGPASYGPGSSTGFASSATTWSGDNFGIIQNVADPPGTLQLIVPQNYQSGDILSATATFENASFASLGITPGEYVWTWPTAAPQLNGGIAASTGTDSFTLIAVPEPSAFLYGGLISVLAGYGYRIKRRLG